jgi:hypothetical protein
MSAPGGDEARRAQKLLFCFWTCATLAEIKPTTNNAHPPHLRTSTQNHLKMKASVHSLRLISGLGFSLLYSPRTFKVSSTIMQGEPKADLVQICEFTLPRSKARFEFAIANPKSKKLRSLKHILLQRPDNIVASKSTPDECIQLHRRASFGIPLPVP